MNRRFLSLGLCGALVGSVLLAGNRRARAEDPDVTAQHERCATRLAIALTGKSADAALMASADPLGTVDAMLGSPDFIARYASFINRSMNKLEGPTPQADASYWLTKRVLETKRPWKDVFVGPYDIQEKDGAVTVIDDPKGLGYFRTRAWMMKYGGNEEAGVRLASAFRMVSNTVGVEIKPAPAVAGQDNSLKGRQVAPCDGCHFNSWFALDKVASVLSRRTGLGNDMSFTPQEKTSVQVLDGKTVTNDKDVVETLVNSDQFLDHQCRLAFTFLYGRSENSCEGATLDRCVDAVRTTGTIQGGLGAMLRDPIFCE